VKPSTRLAALCLAAAMTTTLITPAGARAARPHAGFQGTITMYAGSYNPPSATTQLPGQTVVNHYALQNLARQWERAHPGVRIQFQAINVSGTDLFPILRTRLTGGTAPDAFFFQPSQQDTFLRANLILDLTPYVSRPNKYVPGNKAWKDIFLPPWTTYARTASGRYATVPQDLVSTGVFYNASITKKLGLRMPPATFAEFMQDLKKVKDAGYLAFDAPNFGLIPWYSASIAPIFMSKTVDTYATLTYHPDYIPGVMTSETWARAVTKRGYRPSKDPGFVAAYSTFKDWAQYFAPGWSTPNAGNPDQLFANGRLAFYWNGTWFAPQLKQQKLSFPYASFWFPAVTRQMSPEAPSKATIPYGVGGYGGISYAVPHALAGSPKLPLVIDWLQFITAPKADAQIVNEAPGLLPAAKGVKGDPAIASLFIGEVQNAKTGGNQPLSFFVNGPFTTEDLGTWQRYTTLYLQGSMGAQEYYRQMDGLFVHSANALIALNDKTKNKTGAWDLSKW